MNTAIYAHAAELERIHQPHPLDFRYLEDFIEDVEANGQLRIVENDRTMTRGRLRDVGRQQLGPAWRNQPAEFI